MFFSSNFTISSVFSNLNTFSILNLCLEGEKSISQRQVILNAKLKELEEKMQELQKSIDYIHWKQGFYNDVLSGKTKYYSNLISVKNDD